MDITVNDNNNNPYDFSKLQYLNTSGNIAKTETTNTNQTPQEFDYNYKKAFEQMREKEAEEERIHEERIKEWYNSDEFKNSGLITHPNDPKNTYSGFRAGPYKGAAQLDRYVPIVKRPKTPLELKIEEMERERGQAYLDQRGYDVNFTFPNNRNLNWIRRYQSDINKEVNSPYTAAKQYWPNEKYNDYSPTHGIITPDGYTKEDEDDNYYNIDLQENIYRDKQRTKRIKATSFTPIDDLEVRQMTPMEWMSRVKSNVTPSINPGFLMASQYTPPMQFNYNETKSPYEQKLQVYIQTINNILAMKQGKDKNETPNKYRGQTDPSTVTYSEYKYLYKAVSDYIQNEKRIKAEKEGKEYMMHNINDNEYMQAYDDYRKQNGLVGSAPLRAPENSSNVDDFQENLKYYKYCLMNKKIYDSQGYNPGSGYACVSGFTDEEGLPTKWFFDNWLYLTPTQEEIDNGEVVGIKIYRNGKLICSNNVAHKPKPKEKENKEASVYFIRTKTKEDGSKDISIYDATHKHKFSKEEVHDYLNKKANEKSHQFSDDYKFAAIGMSSTPKDFRPELETPEYMAQYPMDDTVVPDFSMYTRMYKSAQEQAEEDDVVTLTTELARYNKYVADKYMWFTTMLPTNALKSLKQVCQSQLLRYRDADELCYVKSFVGYAGDKTFVTEAKPTTDKEIEELSKKVPYDVSGLKKCKTLKEKVDYLKAYKDARVIPLEKDEAYKYIRKLMKTLNNTQAYNESAYQIYKNLYRCYKKGDPLTFESRFYKWWMKPRTKMSEKEYRKKYILRMSRLAAEHMDDIAKRAIPYSEYINRKIKEHNDFLIKLTHGRILNMKTLADGDYVANAIINYGKMREADLKARSFHTNESGLAFMHQLEQLEKEAEKNGGLDPCAKQIYDAPPYQAPTYEKGVVLDPTLPKDQRAQQYINMIWRKKKGYYV